MRCAKATVTNARQVGVAALLINLTICAVIHLAHAISFGWWDVPGMSKILYHSMTILPMLTALACLFSFLAFVVHARAEGTTLHRVLRQHLTARRFCACLVFLLMAFPWGHRIKSHQWVSQPWMWLFYRWLLLTLVLAQLVFLLRLFRLRIADCGLRIGGRGLRTGDCGLRNNLHHSAFRTPHSALRILRTPPRRPRDNARQNGVESPPEDRGERKRGVDIAPANPLPNPPPNFGGGDREHPPFRTPHSALRILRSDVAFVAVMMALVFLETNIISWKVLEHVAHVQDAIAQLFQAKIFSLGRWYLDPPPLPDPFRYPHVVLEEKWYGIYPPGFASILALGVLAGMAWLVNPFLSMLIVPVLYAYGKQLYGPNVARLAVVLLSLSPFFLGMGSSMMNHPLALLLLLLLALALEHAKKRWTGFILSGFLSGYAFIVRPLTAVGIGVPLVAFFAAEQRKKPARLLRGAVLFLAGLLPCSAMMLVMNAKTTGNSLISGYEVYFDGNPIGFGHRPWGKHPGGFISSHQIYHTPQLGLANWSINLNDANRDLLGWPIAGLFLLVYIWLGRRSPIYQDRKMAWICAGLGIAYIFYYYQDLCYGPRNIYESIPYGLLLISRGLFSLRDDIGTALKLKAKQLVAASLLVLIFLECITALTTVPRLVSYYRRNYWLVTGELRSLVQKTNLDRAIVFVHPELNYGNGFQLNPPDMVSGPLFVEDLGPESRAEVIAAYPDRLIYYAIVDRVDNGRPVPRLTREPLEEDQPKEGYPRLSGFQSAGRMDNPRSCSNTRSTSAGRPDVVR